MGLLLIKPAELLLFYTGADSLKSLVGRGRAPVIDQAGWAVPTGRCDRTRDVQLGKLHVD